MARQRIMLRANLDRSGGHDAIQPWSQCGQHQRAPDVPRLPSSLVHRVPAPPHSGLPRLATIAHHNRFFRTQYTFSPARVAQGVEFPYTITVHRDLPGTIPFQQDIGSASGPSPSGLYPFVAISGGGHEYALRDGGLSSRQELEPRTVKRGTFQQRFAWDGRNWNGPSDYNAPKGPPFPPGSYTLTVRIAMQRTTANGSETYSVKANVPVQLTL